MPNPKKFISAVLVLFFLVAIGYLAYPPISTKLAIRSSIKETLQLVSPDDYPKLKKIDIQTVVQTTNPFEYWVVTEYDWTETRRKELEIVNTAEKKSVHLSDINNYWKITFISAEKVVVIQDLDPNSNPRWKQMKIFEVNEPEIKIYSDYNQEIGGLRLFFARKNEVFESGDDYLYPLFSGKCENDVSTNKFMVNLSGIKLKNKYNSNLQNIYFQHPVQVECKKYEDPMTGQNYYMHPANNSLNYEEPYIVTSLPGNITIKIDVNKLRTGTQAGWADPETMLKAFQDKKEITFKNTK